MSASRELNVVGLEPWFPWPLHAWGWWTRPVRAERLAALRIGLAGCLLIDILTSYGPHLAEFFGQGGLGGAKLFAYYGAAPRLNWSLLRGFGDPLLSALAFGAWGMLTIWFALDLWGIRAFRLPEKKWFLIWLAAGITALLGNWARSVPSGSHRLLSSWQDDPFLLTGVFWTWVAATALLLVGRWTRIAAVLTWALTLSFANVNPNIDNAGDTIRGITLFYLMLCPCGAVWSVDRLLQRRREINSAPVHVWPWPLRLLFIQLIFIYFMNGLYKLTGTDWFEGNSLYYVLCDLTLTRFSIAQLPVPFFLAKVATWLVLIWELTFPVLVLFRATRWLALLIGVAFHLGILATLELGGFVPYVLCLYLPLLPWEKWLQFPIQKPTMGGRV
jgi:uncharacterized membrane protein YphA (DoxX/SURF4 family)